MAEPNALLEKEESDPYRQVRLRLQHDDGIGFSDYVNEQIGTAFSSGACEWIKYLESSTLFNKPFVGTS